MAQIPRAVVKAARLAVEIRAMGDARNHYLTDAIDEAVAPIATELRTRLHGDLSERDAVAVHTAVLKAAMAGARLGASEVVASLVEQGKDVRLELRYEEIDEWRDRYG